MGELIPPGTLTISSLLTACRRNIAFIVLFTLVVTGSAYVVLQYLPKSYTATSVAWLGGRQADMISATSMWSAVNAEGVSSETAARTIASVFHSLPVMRRLTLSLELYKDPDALDSQINAFKANVKRAVNDIVEGDDGTPRLMASRVANAGSSQVSDAAGADVGGDIAGADVDAPLEEDIQGAAYKLSQALTINVDMLSDLVTITAETLEPELAARIVNAVPDAFAAEQAGRMQGQISGTISWLEGRVEELRTEVARSERALETYRVENGLLPNGADEAGTSSLDSLRNARLEAAAALAKLEEARASIETQSTDAGPFETSTMRELVSRRAEAAGRRGTLIASVGDKHALVKAVDQKIAALDAEIKAEKQRLLAEFERDYDAARADAEEAAAAFQAARSENAEEASRGALAAAGSRALQRDVDANRALYNDMLARLKQARQAALLGASMVEMVQPALVPTKPGGLSKTLLLALAGVGSFGFSIALVVGMAVINRRIVNVQQVDAMGFDSIVIAPIVKKSQLRGGGFGRLNGDAGRSNLSRAKLLFGEAIRKLLVVTAFHTPEHGEGHVVLVTSGSTQEGKSTIAHALASGAKASGIETVLLEADLRRAGQPRSAAFEANGGLTAYLEGRVELDDILVEEPKSGLAVVPVTHTVQYSTELITSDRMQEAIEALRQRFAFIVVDAPPACMTSDPEVLATYADDVVVVMRQRASTIDRTKSVIDLISRVTEAKLIGLLNMADETALQSYYGPGEYLYRAVPVKRGLSDKFSGLISRRDGQDNRIARLK